MAEIFMDDLTAELNAVRVVLNDIRDELHEIAVQLNSIHCAIGDFRQTFSNLQRR